MPGCQVHLADRPIHITMKRALASLSLWQKIKLAFNVLTSTDSITKEEVEKCKNKDLLEGMLEELAGKVTRHQSCAEVSRICSLAHSIAQESTRP